jgi:hypothetical protein
LAASPLAGVATVTLAWPAAAQDGYTNAHHLGGSTSFHQPPLTTVATLKKMAGVDTMAADIRKLLRDAGYRKPRRPSSTCWTGACRRTEAQCRRDARATAAGPSRSAALCPGSRDRPAASAGSREERTVLFIDMLGGKDRRVRPTTGRTTVDGSTVIANSGSSDFAQCSPLVRLKIGVGRKFQNDSGSERRRRRRRQPGERRQEGS